MFVPPINADCGVSDYFLIPIWSCLLYMENIEVVLFIKILCLSECVCMRVPRRGRDDSSD